MVFSPKLVARYQELKEQVPVRAPSPICPAPSRTTAHPHDLVIRSHRNLRLEGVDSRPPLQHIEQICGLSIVVDPPEECGWRAVLRGVELAWREG